MSSYFFGGFSANLIEPSGRQSNHSGMLLEPGMIRRALDGEVERDLQAVLARRLEPQRRNPRMSPSSGWIASWPPLFEPIA
jgi:hypothetical protein